MDFIQVLETIYSNLKKNNIQIINSKIVRKSTFYLLTDVSWLLDMLVSTQISNMSFTLGIIMKEY